MKNKVKAEKKMIAMGYNQILEKVKHIRQMFSDAFACGTREISGRMILEHFVVHHRQGQFHQAQTLVELMQLYLPDKIVFFKGKLKMKIKVMIMNQIIFQVMLFDLRVIFLKTVIIRNIKIG